MRRAALVVLALLGSACQETATAPRDGGVPDAAAPDGATPDGAATQCPAEVPRDGTACVGPLTCEYVEYECLPSVNAHICNCYGGAFSCRYEEWCGHQFDAGPDVLVDAGVD
ncbi:MAG TPA: hypothetical protein VGQ83_24580 [Polyangia bacterium]|jgi:hypothetical protein